MDGFLTFIAFLAFAALIIGIIALIKGEVRWARVNSRKQGGILIAVSFALFLLGGALAPPVDELEQAADEEPTEEPSPAPSDVQQFTLVEPPPPPPVTVAPPPPPAPAPQPVAPRPPAPRPPAPAPAPQFVAPPPAPVAPPPPASAFYANCTAARNAGAAPVRRGDPGYGSHLDRDDDGFGCE